MKKSSNSKDYQEWVIKANQDLEAAETLYKSRKANEIICFHCQQAVEKYLKALLVYGNIYFEKSHNLWVLAKKAMQLEPNFRLFEKQLKTLDAYYISTRYPGEAVEISRAEAKEALNTTKELIGFTKLRLK